MREFIDLVHVNLVCLQETKVAVIDQYIVMHHLTALLACCGDVRGILLAWDSALLQVDQITLDTNFLMGLVRLKDANSSWMTIVYGPQGDKLKTQFLPDRVARRLLCPRPRASEKSN